MMVKNHLEDINPIGREIKSLLDKQHLNQKDLRRELSIQSGGVYNHSTSSMSRMLSNDAYLNGALLKLIAEILGVKPGALFGEAEDD